MTSVSGVPCCVSPVCGEPRLCESCIHAISDQELKLLIDMNNDGDIERLVSIGNSKYHWYELVDEMQTRSV